jgi:ATP-dependent helicase/DNAse subunit B
VEQGERVRLNPALTLTVYPTALKARAVVRDQVRRSGVVLGSTTTTFPELTDTLARQLGVTGRILAPELAALVLEAAVADVPTLADNLGRRRRGLLRELQRTIDEFKGARIAPDDLRQVTDAMPTFEGAARVGELAQIYQAYERRLRSVDALDRHGREWALAERLAVCVERGERPAALAGVERIVFAELYDFSVLQFLIATALIRLVGDAELVAFAHPDNVDATRFLDRTWNRFVASEPIAAQVLPSFIARGGRQGSLAVALRGVFAQPAVDPAAGDGSIRLLVAPHRYGEVEAVLRDVRSCLERGLDPERVALVARDLGPYAELIDDVARRFRVPLYFRKGESLLASGAVREAIALVRCALDGVPRPRLAVVLDSDYFARRRPGASTLLARAGYVAAQVSSVDACLTRYEQLEGGAAAPAGPQARRTLARHGEAVRTVATVVAGLSGTRVLGAHVRRLRSALGQLGFRAVAREALDPVAAARDARAWQRFDELLSALALLSRALGLGPMGLDEFLGLVLAVAQLEQASESPLAGGVRALSILDARGLDFDIVYLLGLDDGTFPAAHRESAILPDVQKRALGTAIAPVVRAHLGERASGLQGGLLRTAREASLEDPFLFFLALSMAERELVLSYPAADERGNPTIRSPFIDEVEACFTDPLPVEVADAAALVPSAVACCEEAELVARAAIDRWRPEAPSLDGVAAALRARVPGGTVRLQEIDRRARMEDVRARYFLTPLRIPRRAALADAALGRIAATPSLQARVDAMRWSPTRVDALAACGFKFFAGRLLGLRERDEPQADVGNRERGTLVHRVLEVLLRAMPVWPSELREARARARAVVEARRDEIVAAIPPKERVLVDLEWVRVLAVVDEVAAVEVAEAAAARASGQTLERWLEWGFAVPVAISSEVAPLTLHGTADRVDVWRRGAVVERVRVRDYKTARDMRDLARGLVPPAPGTARTAYQVPLYLDAAARTVEPEGHGESVLEGGYWSPLAPPGQRERSRQFTRAELGQVEDELRALVAGARAGRFDVAPQRCDEWCPYRTVCRYQPPPVEDDGG